jgi:hypothetical protein
MTEGLAIKEAVTQTFLSGDAKVLPVCAIKTAIGVAIKAPISNVVLMVVNPVCMKFDTLPLPALLKLNITL